MKRIFNLALFASLVLISCTSRNKSYSDPFTDGRIYSRTVKELNNVVMQNNFPPIIASRNYLYANIAAYEVIAAGNPSKYESLAGQLNDLPAIPQPDSTLEIDFPFAAVLAFCKLGDWVPEVTTPIVLP